jgi:hypothetical protein
MRSESANSAVIRAAVRDFVARRAPEPGTGTAIDDSTPLFTLRILRSVHLPELIILLERLRGAPIDVESLAHGDFESIDTIVERFGKAP